MKKVKKLPIQRETLRALSTIPPLRGGARDARFIVSIPLSACQTSEPLWCGQTGAFTC